MLLEIITILVAAVAAACGPLLYMMATNRSRRREAETERRGNEKKIHDLEIQTNNAIDTLRTETNQKVHALELQVREVKTSWNGHIAADEQFHSGLNSTLARLEKELSNLGSTVNELNVNVARLSPRPAEAGA